MDIFEILNCFVITVPRVFMKFLGHETKMDGLHDFFCLID